MREAAVFGDALIEEKVEKDRYRYQLYRKEARQRGLFFTPCWAWPDQTICFCMLNPSTADEVQDDPTIRRCRNFAKHWGFEHVYIVNIFAWRATDPHQLSFWHRKGLDVVGPLNDIYILRCAVQSKVVIIAWGVVSSELQWREKEVLDLLAPFSPMALGLSKKGHPRHPLYLKANSEPFRYKEEIIK